jgi:hypothetical protein
MAKKLFIDPQMGNDLVDILNERDLKVQGLNRNMVQGSSRDSSTKMFVLESAITNHTDQVDATPLIAIRSAGLKKAYHIQFDQEETESASITVNGTALAGTFDKDTTTTELRTAIDTALGTHTVQSGVVAGNIFIWNCTSVASTTPTQIEVDYYPELRAPFKAQVRALKLETDVSYALGSVQYCVFLTTAGWCVVASSGGSTTASGSCNSCCTSVQVGNMLHPDLTSGFDETTRDWIAQSACGGAIASVTIPNASGSLRLVWPGGTPTLTYEDTDDTFVFEITDDCTILDVDGVDVTGSTSFEAFITMDFAALTVVISWEEL